MPPNQYSRSLAIAALLLSSLFMAVLCATGFSKYASVLAGGPNFNDFPAGPQRSVAMLSYLGLMGVYALWLWQTPVFPQRFSTLLKQARPFLALAFLAYPYSSDAYLYVHYGTMVLQGVNPYLHPATDVLSPFSPLLQWFQSATYGPVSMVIFSLSAGLIALHPLLALLGLKGFCLGAHVLNAYLISRSLDSPQNPGKFTALYLLNPVLLNEFVVNAHVDVFLTTTIILFIHCLYRHRDVSAMVWLWVGCLTKTLPILWFPLVVGYFIRRRQWRSLWASVGIILVTIALLSLTVLPSFAAWKSLLNPGVSGLTARSLYHGLNLILEHGLAIGWDDRAILLGRLSALAYGGFLGFYLWRGLSRWKQQTDSPVQLVADLGWVTVVLLLFATPWLMPWYPTGLVAIAIASRSDLYLRRIILVFCMTPSLVLGTGAGGELTSLVAVIVTVGPGVFLLITRLTELSQSRQH